MVAKPLSYQKWSKQLAYFQNSNYNPPKPCIKLKSLPKKIQFVPKH